MTPQIFRKGQREFIPSNMSVFRAPSICAHGMCVAGERTERPCMCVWQTDVVPKRLALSDKESNTACSCVCLKRHFLQYVTFCARFIDTAQNAEVVRGCKAVRQHVSDVRGRVPAWKVFLLIAANKKAGPGFDPGEDTVYSAASVSLRWYRLSVHLRVHIGF